LWRLEKAVVGYFGSHEDSIDLAFSRFDVTFSRRRGPSRLDMYFGVVAGGLS